MHRNTNKKEERRANFTVNERSTLSVYYRCKGIVKHQSNSQQDGYINVLLLNWKCFFSPLPMHFNIASSIVTLTLHWVLRGTTHRIFGLEMP